MLTTVFEETKTYIGFSGEDAARLRRLGPIVRPHFPRVVERFYQAILQHPGARAVFAEGQQQVERLKRTLAVWLEELFVGEYDEAYRRNRLTIGRVHVQVGLPQHYMFAAMEIIWQELERAVRQEDPPEAIALLGSLHKLLTIEIGIMLESYKESYTAQVRDHERHVVEDRLTRAEHLAEIGQLAANIAHEVKNPLAGISGAIQVIGNALATDDPHREVIGEILRQIDRLDRAVHDLLLYSRPPRPRLRTCNLDAVISQTLSALREGRQLKRVRIDYAAEPSALLEMEGDESQLQQVVMNLLINACDAPPDAAVVRIRTAGTPDTVRLVIADEGIGIEADLLPRIFEPFFTTKARGTGLGLPICQKVVDAHGGELTVTSTPGQGTVVTVELPRNPPQTLP